MPVGLAKLPRKKRLLQYFNKNFLAYKMKSDQHGVPWSVTTDESDLADNEK